MKYLLMGAALIFALSAYAQDPASIATSPNGSEQFNVFNPSTADGYQLQDEDLDFRGGGRGPGPGHGGPGGGGHHGPHPGPGPRPGPGGGGHHGPHPDPGGGHHGPRPGRPGHPGRPIYPGGGGHGHGWDPRPGWHDGWRWDHGNWHPGWWYPGIVFPVFVWDEGIPPGYWQCTAFDSDMDAFSAEGVTPDQAAYNAMYDCGGPYYQDEENGCYIPEGYCQQY